MISEEKMVHIAHLIIDGLYKVDFVDYADDDEALKETKRICLGYIKHLSRASEVASARIKSQKNPPMEHSPQWDNLYNKYLEEELKKVGGP